jgi:hypothetical protein
MQIYSFYNFFNKHWVAIGYTKEKGCFTEVAQKKETALKKLEKHI